MFSIPKLYKDYTKSGKGIPFFFYIKGVLNLLLPGPLLRLRKNLLLRDWEKRPDADEIRKRVDFYCSLSEPFTLGENSVRIGDIRLGKVRSRYAIDAYRILKYFPKDERVNFFAGDIWENPALPTLIRGRRIGAGHENGVMLNMDSTRHFLHPRDTIPFADKKPKLFFRGNIHGKPMRVKFFEMWASNPDFDLGDTDYKDPSQWYTPSVSIADHFDYKFILTLEGNDVASALQWVMASNCVPVMPRPTAEGWLMHSRLIPGIHYIEIAADFSDAGEKIDYYVRHPEEAEKISVESKKWASEFFNRRRELIISLLVVEKYLSLARNPVRK